MMFGPFLAVAAVLAGEGWGYILAAALLGGLLGGLAPAWFAVARYSESGLTKSHETSNSNTAPDPQRYVSTTKIEVIACIT
jgi:hypothetical protein